MCALFASCVDDSVEWYVEESDLELVFPEEPDSAEEDPEVPETPDAPEDEPLPEETEEPKTESDPKEPLEEPAELMESWRYDIALPAIDIPEEDPEEPSAASPNETETPEEPEEEKVVASFSLDVTHDNGEYTVSGENLEYLDDMYMGYNAAIGHFGLKLSIYQRALPQANELLIMLNKSININYEDILLSEDTSFSNHHITAHINGEPVKVALVKAGLGIGYSEFYIFLDCDISEEEFKSLTFAFK